MLFSQLKSSDLNNMIKLLNMIELFSVDFNQLKWPFIVFFLWGSFDGFGKKEAECLYSCLILMKMAIP